MAINEFVKGESFMNCGYFYCPYVQLIETETLIPNPYNTWFDQMCKQALNNSHNIEINDETSLQKTFELDGEAAATELFQQMVQEGKIEGF